MKLLFDKARWMMDSESTWLMLKVNRRDATAFCDDMKDGKVYEADLKEHRKKRSLDANAMAWKILGELSVVTRVSPEEMYRNYIRDVGGNYEIVPVREDHIDDWNKVWCSGHYGRSTEDIGECRTIPGYHYIKSYIGSSDYDTAQMSRLLDLIIDDCKTFGVPVMTEQERSLLLDDWGKKK